MTTDQNSNPMPLGGSASFDASPAIGSGDAFTVGAFVGSSLEASESKESAVAPPTRSGIEFRVVREGSPTRRLRLSGARYTFGSGDGCSICLDDESLRPLHAVLIRDDQRVVVRAYSIPIEINGNRTTEATLSVGDVMRLGDYSFELASLAASTDIPAERSSDSAVGNERVEPSKTTSDTPASDSAGIRPIEETGFGRLSFADASVSGAGIHGSDPGQPTEGTGALSMPTEAIRPPSSTSQVEEQVWRERLRREIDSWRQRQADCDRQTHQCNERESELRKRETELWNRADRLTTREATLKAQESAAYEIQKEYAIQQEQVTRLREERERIAAKLEQREAEFRRREDEYRHQADDATQQLHQSREQAEMASQAVQRMREQLSALNAQMEELSHARQDLEVQDKQRQADFEQQRIEWEASRELATLQRDEAHRERDAAIDARAKSEAEIQRSRSDAEQRLREMEAQLHDHASGSDDQADQLRISESLVDELRAQVVEVQQTLQEAQNEAAQLRSDYDQARDTITKLEEANQNESPEFAADRERWNAETSELRLSIESLSQQLAAANDEMADLRRANEAMSQRLDALQSERDEAIANSESRPSQESFDAITKELDRTIEQLNHLQHENDALISKADASPAGGFADGGLTAAARPIASASIDAVADTQFEPAAPESDAAVSEPEPEDEPVAKADSSESAWNTVPVVSEVEDSNAVSMSEDQAGAGYSPETAEASQVEGDEEAWPSYDDGNNADEDEQFANPWATASEESHGPESESFNGSTESPQVASPDGEIFTESKPEATTDERSWAAEQIEVGQNDEEVDGGQLTSSWSVPVEDEASADSEFNAPPNDGEEIRSLDSTSPSWSGQVDEPEPASAWDNSPELIEPAEDTPPQTPPAAIPEGSLASQLLRDITGNSEASEEPGFSSGTLGDHSAQSSAEPVDTGSAWNLGVEGDAVGADDEEDVAMTYQPTQQFSLEQHASESVLDGNANRPLVDGSEVDQMSGTYQSAGGIGNVEHMTATEEQSDLESSVPDEPISEDDSSLSDAEYVASSHVLDSEDHEPEPVDEPTAEGGDEAAPEDDSIEAYMNRLLQRVQGGTPVPAAAPADVSKAKPSQTELTEETPVVSEPTEPEPPVDPSAPLIARSQAPEKNTNLSAMRQLANDSARSAIDRSTRLQSRDAQLRAMSKFLVAAVVLICGLGVMFAVPQMWIKMIGISAGLFVAFCFVRDGMLILRDTRRRMLIAMEEADEAPSE